MYYQWVRRGLSLFAEGIANHWHVMCTGEECSDCYHCKLAALWGRTDGVSAHLANRGGVGSVIKVNGSGTLAWRVWETPRKRIG